MIAFMIDEDLGFIGEAAKSCGMNDPVPIALERCPQVAGRLVEESPAALPGYASICGDRPFCRTGMDRHRRHPVFDPP
jgi:hypothetical protein